MPFDGSGNFNRVMNWVSDASAAIKIRADRHDAEDDNLAAGLSNTLTKDGQSQPTANIPMNGKRLVNLGAPVNPTDAATKAYADAIKTFAQSLEISGADANGRLKFTSATGANGLAFTGADLSWLARPATAAPDPVTKNRLVLNDKPDGSGTDVVTINDDGSAVFNGRVDASGIISSKGSVVEVTSSNTAAGTNAHFRILGAGGAERMLLYAPVNEAGNVGLRVGGTQTFAFQNNGEFKAPTNVWAGACYLTTNGNLGGTGSIWANWGANDAYNAIGARIEARGLAWANDRVANLQYRKVSEGVLSGGPSGAYRAPAGSVFTGFNRGTTNGTVTSFFYMYLQVYDPVRGWVGFTG